MLDISSASCLSCLRLDRSGRCYYNAPGWTPGRCRPGRGVVTVCARTGRRSRCPICSSVRRSPPARTLFWADPRGCLAISGHDAVTGPLDYVLHSSPRDSPSLSPAGSTQLTRSAPSLIRKIDRPAIGCCIAPGRHRHHITLRLWGLIGQPGHHPTARRRKTRGFGLSSLCGRIVVVVWSE